MRVCCMYGCMCRYAGKEDYEPTHCSQTCSKTYKDGGRTYLDKDCIDCDDIPQMSNVSVMWQVHVNIC